ncbi:MAG: HAD family hydrolase [Alphaproteobacteria bacterium RIFCSPHIGHO2_12_FULL_63_12]|nr:MAG: HAD family hydrolase [Alphaproteobacteria bacterium RIFCSPHIGHO2_12_FULL_63_12]
MIDLIAFDADDTLWHNERFFKLTKESFAGLLADYAQADHLEERLLAAEKRNLSRYGFGVKGFTLSMIETAIEVSGADLPASVVKQILDAGRDMLDHPVELLPGVGETIDRLSKTHRLVIVTKGDLFHQERKIAASGIADYFAGVEIVSDKSPETYRSVFARHGAGPGGGLMIGNSLKSDVIPAIEAGGWGVYVPHELTWVIERAEAPREHPRYREIPAVSALPALIEGLTGA